MQTIRKGKAQTWNLSKLCFVLRMCFYSLV
nr:MAG TPA: hypothetical protein [Caudoviricetes sp.]